VIDGRAAGERAPAYEGWRVVAALGVVTVIAYGSTQYLFSLIVRPVAADRWRVLVGPGGIRGRRRADRCCV
jgi:hypothetical protein